jgi:hypothetical protein
MDSTVYNSDVVGEVFNKYFVSIKVQSDTAKRDSRAIQSWYPYARDIINRYSIDAFPSFLFLSPNGTLIQRGVGLKSKEAFITMGRESLDSNTFAIANCLEEYINHRIVLCSSKKLSTYAISLGLDSLASKIAGEYIAGLTLSELLTKENILLVLDVMKDRIKANELAVMYLTSTLNKLSSNDLLSKDNLEFLNRFLPVVESKDKIFQLCYSFPRLVDSIIGKERWATLLVERVIRNEELEKKVELNGSQAAEFSDWNYLYNNVRLKYPTINAEKLVNDFKIKYYRNQNDWKKWAKCLDHKLNTQPLKNGDGFWELNLPAWDAFLFCNNRKVLKTALKWSNRSIEIDQPDPNLQCFDTKANILYKLGNVKEAIKEEMHAIEMSNEIAKKEGSDKGPFIDDYRAVLDLMRQGKPIYHNEILNK